MAAVMRDLRIINAMDDDTKRIHLRCEAWALVVGDDSANAWPKVTLLGRLIEQGPNGASQTGRPPVAMSDEVAVVDAGVAKLGQIDRKVIKIYYLHWASIEVMARLAGMSVPQFRNVLRRARWRLMGYIDAHEA